MEGAAGLGRLLDWQLVAAGERVLDVQPKLAARVRLLQTGNAGKSDPDDALSVAVAALRSRTWREVIADACACVLKVRAKRHRDLSRARNQAACRLHAVLCELVPGGVPDGISAARAARIVGQIRPSGAAAQALCELAAELLADIGHLDARRREARKKRAAAVRASGTSITEIFLALGRSSPSPSSATSSSQRGGCITRRPSGPVQARRLGRDRVSMFDRMLCGHSWLRSG